VTLVFDMYIKSARIFYRYIHSTSEQSFRAKAAGRSSLIQPPPPFSPRPCCCTQSAFWTLPSTAALHRPRMHHKQSTGKKERESARPVTALDVPLSKHGSDSAHSWLNFFGRRSGGETAHLGPPPPPPRETSLFYTFLRRKIRKKASFHTFFSDPI
jgi:hypothetical protein